MVTVMSMIRKEKDVTQIDLANEVGITQAEISMIERGKVTPKDETLEKIAHLLATPKDELLLPYAEWLEAQFLATRGRIITK
jgi:transcriptional regulator with XRE-family HTH domain